MKHPDPITTPKSPRFNLGKIYITPGASETIDRLQVDPFELLYRHKCGDFGCLCPADIKANEDALRYGSRILSSYELLTASIDIESAEEPGKIKIWVITEADRSITTMLLPSEY